MSFAKLPAADLDGWRHEPATVELARTLRQRRQSHLERMAQIAQVGDDVALVRALAGRVAELDELVLLMNVEGSKEP